MQRCADASAKPRKRRVVPKLLTVPERSRSLRHTDKYQPSGLYMSLRHPILIACGSLSGSARQELASAANFSFVESMCVFSHLVAFISVEVLPVSRSHCWCARAKRRAADHLLIDGFSSFQQRAECVMASRKGFRVRLCAWFGRIYAHGDSPSRQSEFHFFFYVKMDPGRFFVRSPRVLRSLVWSLPRLRSTRNFDALGIFFGVCLS